MLRNVDFGGNENKKKKNRKKMSAFFRAIPREIETMVESAIDLPGYVIENFLSDSVIEASSALVYRRATMTGRKFRDAVVGEGRNRENY